MAESLQNKQRITSSQAVVYGRCSANQAAQARINDQAAACRRYAKRRDLPMPPQVIQDVGVCGGAGLAPNFQALLKDVSAGKVQAIFVSDLSRISRRLTVLRRVQRALRRNGASLWCVDVGGEMAD